MGLRLVEGIDPAVFAALSGRELSGPASTSLIAEGLLTRKPGGKLAATPDGRAAAGRGGGGSGGVDQARHARASHPSIDESPEPLCKRFSGQARDAAPAGCASASDCTPVLLRPRPQIPRRGVHRDDLAVAQFEHGEAAVDLAVGPEAEDAVGAGETRGIGQHRFGEALRALRARQRRRERDRVIGQRRGAGRGAVEALPDSGRRRR